MLKLMFLLIILILPLAACSSNQFSQYSEEIQEASARLAEVDNGHFTVETTIQQDSDTVENSTEGKFVTTDEGTNWQTTARVEGAESDMDTQTELIHLDSETYERFGLIDQEGNYIDQNNDVIEDQEWTRLDQEEDDELNPLNSLLGLDLDESIINEISKEEREGDAIYTVNTSDEYLEKQREESLTELENKLKRLEDKNGHKQAQQTIEHNIAYVEALSYEESVHTYIVDSEGVLVGHTLQTEVTENVARVPGAEPGQLTTTNVIEIPEYNATDIEINMNQ